MDGFNRYVGGFFDADGCVGIYRNGKYYHLRISFGNTSRLAIDAIYDYYGVGSICGFKRDYPAKDGFTYTATGNSALKIAEDIVDYTYEKRDRLELAIEFQNHMNAFGICEDTLIDRENMREQMAVFNRRGKECMYEMPT